MQCKMRRVGSAVAVPRAASCGSFHSLRAKVPPHLRPPYVHGITMPLARAILHCDPALSFLSSALLAEGFASFLGHGLCSADLLCDLPDSWHTIGLTHAG